MDVIQIMLTWNGQVWRRWWFAVCLRHASGTLLSTPIQTRSVIDDKSKHISSVICLSYLSMYTLFFFFLKGDFYVHSILTFLQVILWPYLSDFLSGIICQCHFNIVLQVRMRREQYKGIVICLVGTWTASLIKLIFIGKIWKEYKYI